MPSAFIFGEVHLPRNQLHPTAFARLRQNAHGGGIAGKGIIREGIDDV
jgi:hypothetical protein